MNRTLVSRSAKNRATTRLLRYALAACAAKDKHDWVALSDLRTSADDARIALRAATGQPLEGS